MDEPNPAATIGIRIIAVRDKRNRVFLGTAHHPAAIVRLGGVPESDSVGVLAANGEEVGFIGSASDVKQWAVEHGLDYREHALTLGMHARKLLNWKTTK